MATRLDEHIGYVDYDGLIASNEPVADVVHVTIAKSSGKIARGTIVTGTAGGALAPLAAAVVATNATYIAADDVDATDEAVTVTAYRSGNFARSKLITKSYTLTAADEENLRKAGIIVSESLAY